MTRRWWIVLLAGIFVLAGCGASGSSMTTRDVIEKLNSSEFPCQGAEVQETTEPQSTTIACNSLMSETPSLWITVYPDSAALEARIEESCSSQSASSSPTPVSPSEADTQATTSSPTVTTRVLNADKAPIGGVRISVSHTDGFSESLTTDANGEATVPVPTSGRYTVAVDEATLPSGLLVKDGSVRLTNVLMGDKKVLFIVGSPDEADSSSPRLPSELLIGGNWLAVSVTDSPSLADLQGVLGGERVTDGGC